MQRTAEHLRRLHQTGARSGRVMRWLTILGMTVTISMMAFGIAGLLDSRQDAWRQAQQASGNLAIAIERDIARNIAVYDLSIQGAAEVSHMAGLDKVSAELRHAALFDRASTAEHLGAILLIDRNGNVIADSTDGPPHKFSFAERDYFRIHKERADAGLFVSRPFNSRVRDGDPSIALSRRISGPHGEFEGVAVGVVRLTYFNELFSHFNLGPQSSVTLLRTDGRIVARYPLRDGDVDRDTSKSAQFALLTAKSSGEFIAGAALDGVKRFYTFRRVGDLPLILSVNLSIDTIYAAWWPKALMIGIVLAALCGATLALCLLFRREMSRRLAVEGALYESAEKLALMAATDGLTGLANRRTFEERLQREWRRAVRARTTTAVLMIDADCFKQFNDRYGHQAGDRVLQTIAGCIGRSLNRPADLGARYGGEEFVVLLPDTDIVGARMVADQIRAAVEGAGIEHPASPGGHATVSIGLAVKRSEPGEPSDSLVKLADDALYEAKRQGRNRVVSAGLKVSGAPAAAYSRIAGEIQ